MTDLTETQRAVLTAAAARQGLQVLPLPDRIKGGAAKKVVDALLARGFVAEAATAGSNILVATEAGLHVIGLGQPVPAADSHVAEEPEAPTTGVAPKQRTGTKQAQLIVMLQAPEGATIAEIAEATGWQHHTVRGAIAGALKKRLGLEVASEKIEGRARVYRICG